MTSDGEHLRGRLLRGHGSSWTFSVQNVQSTSIRKLTRIEGGEEEEDDDYLQIDNGTDPDDPHLFIIRLPRDMCPPPHLASKAAPTNTQLPM